MLKSQKIDELILPDHYHLNSDDKCLYLREYTPRAGHSFSETNQLIINFKKTVDRKGRPEWHHKERAIERIIRELAAGFKLASWQKATLVPIPPSKCKDNPLYDDRMTRVLKGIGPHLDITCDVRELIIQNEDMDAVHLNATNCSHTQAYCRVW